MGQCGSSHHDLLQEEVPLGKPDVLICSVGTEIFMDVDSPAPVSRESWTRKLDQGWDRKAIVEAASKHSQLKLQVRGQMRELAAGTSSCRP